MRNGDKLQGWNEHDGCPVHGNRVRKCYTFGKYGSAEVWTFSGCRCAVCVDAESLLLGVPLGHEYSYHTNYPDAAGAATLIKMQDAVENAPFEYTD